MKYLVNEYSNTVENFKNVVAGIGNIKSNVFGHNMVGVSFKSRKNFPKITECESCFVKKGEVVKVVDYDEHENEYVVVNLSMNTGLDVNYSWIRTNNLELNDMLNRKSS